MYGMVGKRQISSVKRRRAAARMTPARQLGAPLLLESERRQ
jgi:hypothetical protein